MMTAVPVTRSIRANVVTPTLTYKAHQLDINEDARTATIMDRMTWEPIAVLTDATWAATGRNDHRVVGLDEDGNVTIWRSVAACARCGAPMVMPTPAYDVPT